MFVKISLEYFVTIIIIIIIMQSVDGLGLERVRTQTGEVNIFSERDDDIHQSGVAVLMSREMADCVECWRLYGVLETSIVQVYPPTNHDDEEAKAISTICHKVMGGCAKA